jgi:hypothetical protein
MKHHLLIAGTGRAGTTFLVQYLAECGLDTHIARDQYRGYDEDANAGLEDLPLNDPDAPYVIKSPWLFEYVERVLADEQTVVDAVVIPMRGIVEAAASRTVNELRARHAMPGTTNASNGRPGARRRAGWSIRSTRSTRRACSRSASTSCCMRW